MDGEDLAFAGIAHQAKLIRGGDVSSRELVELYLERIEHLNPELNAFTEVLGERALADAGAADARRAEGEQAPLLGVPIAIKDNVDVEGVTTWRGAQRHQQLLERGKTSERVFIDALVDIDASIKQSNERSAEITASIRDMRESIRANTQAVLSVLDRLGPAPDAG